RQVPPSTRERLPCRELPPPAAEPLWLQHGVRHKTPDCRPGAEMRLSPPIAERHDPGNEEAPGSVVAAGGLRITGKSDSALSFLRLRIADLRARVEKERATSAKAVEKYQPTTTGRVDDLGCPVADLLRQLPGVAQRAFGDFSGRPTTRSP